MAIRSIMVNNFKGIHNESFGFRNQNTLLGKNGTGKSSIKDAIAFAFCGTDSEGNRSPLHLISWEQPATEVTVLTDKATVTRKLTSKGSASLKLTRGDVITPLTQAQMDQLVGSVDTFLSGMNVGYFFRLPMEKQHKVLTELLPSIDRRQVLQDLLGWPLNDEEVLFLGLGRRTDLIASTAAGKRRMLEKEEATLQGQITGLESLGQQEAPLEPKDSITVASKQTMLDSLWKDYIERQERSVGEQIRALKKQEKSAPGVPIYAEEVSWDNCPTCGQIVGAKHREKVLKLNLEVKEKYDREFSEVTAYNKGLREQADELARSLYEVRNKGKRILEGAPEEAYDAYTHQEAQKEINAYMHASSSYKLWLSQKEKANETIVQLQGKIASLSSSIGRLSAIEKAAGELPKRELDLQQQALHMPNIKVDIGDRLYVTYKGKPYESLSDGQKIQAGIEMAVKFNELMKKPVGVIFVDNADLIDNQDYLQHLGIQWLLAKVDSTVGVLEIKSCDI